MNPIHTSATPQVSFRHSRLYFANGQKERIRRLRRTPYIEAHRLLRRRKHFRLLHNACSTEAKQKFFQSIGDSDRQCPENPVSFKPHSANEGNEDIAHIREPPELRGSRETDLVHWNTALLKSGYNSLNTHCSVDANIHAPFLRSVSEAPKE